MPDFGVRHPEYLRNIDRWQMQWDIYRGERYVLQPHGRMGTLASVTRGSLSDKESEDTPSMAIPWYRARDGYSYLHRGVRESDAEFDARHNKALHFPLFRSIVDIYTSAALRIGADRGSVDSVAEPWGTYWRDIDGCGTTIDAFERQALTMALVFGRVAAVTDRPRSDQEWPSKAHQMAAGDRPYTYLVLPQFLVDWELDEHGRPLWVTLWEPRRPDRLPGVSPSDVINFYRVLSRDRYDVFAEVKDGKGKSSYAHLEDRSGEHPVGEVPIAFLFARRSHARRDSLEADSILADLVDIDRSMFNQYSLLLEQIYNQVYAQLCLPVRPGDPVPNLEVGPLRVIGYDSEGGQPLYLSPDTDLVRVQQQQIDGLAHSARQLALVGRGRAEYSKEERSAQALGVEQADKHNVIASLADAVQSFDRQHHRHAAAWEGKSQDAPEASYNKEITLKGVNEQISEAIQLATPALRVPAKALALLVKPIVGQALREKGQPESVVAEALRAVDEAAERAENADSERPLLHDVRNGEAGPMGGDGGERQDEDDVR